jgi:DNA-binding transcriptional LysR family regulator
METITKNLEDLVAFHVVAVDGSFTKAAETLGTSKAMVSKQVKRLETYLRSQLFHRTTRTLNLTEEGTALLEYSQKVFDLSDEASRRLRDMTQGAIGNIRISAPVSLGEVIFPTLLKQLQKDLPNVNFEIDLANENRDFIKDQVDFALRAAEVDHPDLIARSLGMIKDVIVAAPEFLAKSKITANPRDLSREECLLHSQNPNWNLWTLNSKEKEIRVEVKGKISTNQYPMARELCLTGTGIARIPLYMVSEDLKSGTLVQLFPEYKIQTHPLYLVYVRNEYAAKKHKITRDLILNWFKQRKDYFVSTTA